MVRPLSLWVESSEWEQAAWRHGAARQGASPFQPQHPLPCLALLFLQFNLDHQLSFLIASFFSLLLFLFGRRPGDQARARRGEAAAFKTDRGWYGGGPCTTMPMPIEAAVAVASLSMASASRSAALCFSSAAAARSRSRRRFLAVSCDAGASDLLYSSLAAKLLGPPTSFDAGKLTVEFAHSHSHGNSSKRSSGFPRAYTLTHCDFTANLTLAVSDTIVADRRLRADDVFAEWKQQQQQEGMALHVHCFVSGANLLHGLAAGFRYYVFSKELPLVLKAVVHGDALLFAEQPELLEAKVWVHFHSSSNAKYNRLECWGPLREAANAETMHKRHALQLDGRLEQLHNAIAKGTRRRRRKWSSPDAIFSALLALLL